MDELLQIPKNQRIWFTVGGLIYLVFLGLGIWFEEPILYYIPTGVLIGIAVMANIKQMWYLAAFCMPLSVTLGGGTAGGASIAFPTDILCILLMGLMCFKMIKERKMYIGMYNHPIFWIVLALFFWMLITALSSSLFVVSIKAFLSSLWMVFAFFLISAMFFEKKIEIERFFLLVGIGFILAESFIMFKYTAGSRSAFNLRFDPRPFFYDHTIYGAFTTLFVPFFFLFTFQKKIDPNLKKLSLAILGFFLIGLFFSYSRGAWASTIGGMVLMYALVKREKVKRFIVPIAAIATVLLIGVISLVETEAPMKEPRDKEEAVSRKTLGQHVLSMTNFSTDYSNTERVNRWMAAIAMYNVSPVVGYGPGTYSFKYGAFQNAKSRTPVSTVRGDMGTAHQEILLALSEMGLPGALLVILLFTVPVFYGVKGYLATDDEYTQMLYLGLTFGLVSYDIHAFVNNFLNQDKIGIPFFAMLAAIVALDISRKREGYLKELEKTISAEA